MGDHCRFTRSAPGRWQRPHREPPRAPNRSAPVGPLIVGAPLPGSWPVGAACPQLINERRSSSVNASTSASRQSATDRRSLPRIGLLAPSIAAGSCHPRIRMHLVLGHAFRAMRLHRVVANIQPENAASIALVRRSGFRLEGFSPRYLKVAGRWRDHQRWPMTIDDWQLLRRRRRVPSRYPARRSPLGSSSPGRRRSG